MPHRTESHKQTANATKRATDSLTLDALTRTHARRGYVYRIELHHNLRTTVNKEIETTTVNAEAKVAARGAR